MRNSRRATGGMRATFLGRAVIRKHWTVAPMRSQVETVKALGPTANSLWRGGIAELLVLWDIAIFRLAEFSFPDGQARIFNQCRQHKAEDMQCFIANSDGLPDAVWC
jgi:hypothetical protein